MPQVPILTIHDSLAVPLPYANQVQHLMEQELASQVGVPPFIKRELWSQQVIVRQCSDAGVGHLKQAA